MEILLLVVVFYLCAYFYWTYKRKDYSHIKHTISELGASGSGFTWQISLFFFLPVGILLALLSYTQVSNEPLALLAASMSVAYIGSALFPIDQGAPISGSWKNVLHNLSGGIEYVGAFLISTQMKTELGIFTIIIQVGIAVFIASLYIPKCRAFRGVFQRVVEVSLFVLLWLVS